MAIGKRDGALLVVILRYDLDRDLDIPKSVMGVEAIGRGQTIQLEGGAAGMIGRPMHQTWIAAPHGIDSSQNFEAIVAVELGGVNVRLQVLVEGLPQNLFIEADGVEAHLCRGCPMYDRLHDGLGKLEQGRQCAVKQLRGVTPVTISACGDGMMCGAMRQRRVTHSISEKSSSVRIAANRSGCSKAGDVPLVSRSQKTNPIRGHFRTNKWSLLHFRLRAQLTQR